MMRKFRLLAKFWAPVIFWVAVIFTFSSLTTPKTSEFYWQDFLTKKTAHLIEYAILFILAYRGFKNSTVLSRQKIVLLAFLLVILYAASDEYHQTFIFGREGRVRDVVIDFAGAGMAWLAIWKYLPKAPEKLKNWAKNWQLI